MGLGELMTDASRQLTELSLFCRCPVCGQVETFSILSVPCHQLLVSHRTTQPRRPSGRVSLQRAASPPALQ